MDWTNYRVAFAERLSVAIGRSVSIDGDMDFVLLPRPAFNADAVRVGGAVADDFVAIERLSARLAFFPLLRGHWQFRELVLQRAEARMTRGNDGVVDFLSLPLVTAPTSFGASPAPASLPLELDVDRIRIEDGALIFQDIANGVTADLRGINVVVAMRREAFSIIGDVSIDRIPLAIEVAVGAAGSTGTQNLSFSATLPEAETTAKLSGTLSSGHAWDLRADLKVAGPSAAGMLIALNLVEPATAMPQVTKKPFAFAARVRGNREAIMVDPMTAEIGGTPAKGVMSWKMRPDGPPRLDVKLEFGAVTLEEWTLAQVTSRPMFRFFGVPTAHAQDATPPASPNASAKAFQNIEAHFDFRAPVMAYRGQTLRGAVFTASLLNGELKVSEAAVELPAATRVRAFGFVHLDGAAVFDGALEMQTSDLRHLLGWLGVDAGKVPQGRLSNAELRAALQGTPSRFTLGDITANIDTSTMTGRVSWQSGPRPSLGADLSINTLNVDAYVPVSTEAVPTAPAIAPVEQGSQPEKPSPYGVTPVLTELNGLTEFDADLRLQVAALTAGGIAGGKMALDLGLQAATLNMRSVSFENVAGVTAWFSGSVGGFGVAPRFDDVQFDFSTADLPRLGRVLGFEVPMVLRRMTPASLTGVLNGTFSQVDLTATLKAASMTIHADGQMLNIDQQPHITLTVEGSQPNYAALMRAMGIFSSNTLDAGAVKLSGQVTHEKANTKVENLSLRVGDNVLAGDLNISTGPQGAEVTGALNAISVVADKVWPKVTTHIDPPLPVARSAGTGKTPVKQAAWSDVPFDWEGLKGWRANVTLSGTALNLRGIQAQDFKCRLLVGDGTAEIAEWTGKVFGAPGQVYVKVAATPAPLVQGEIAFLGGDLAGVATAMNGGTPVVLKSGGKADFAGSFRAEGATPAAMVASVSGSGSVKIAATEVGSGPISGLLGAVAAANQLESMSRGLQKGSAITLESRFSAAEGRINIEDATVASKSYGGAFSGTIDLARWQVDLTGRLRLEAPGGQARPVAVPMTVKGALDLPNITLLPGN
jgi:uncharacterized protein involved in outer membrane biogenesis